MCKQIRLKMLELPDVEIIEESLDEAQKWASSVGYKEEDVNDIIKSVRRSKRNEIGKLIMGQVFEGKRGAQKYRQHMVY